MTARIYQAVITAEPIIQKICLPGLFSPSLNTLILSTIYLISVITYSNVGLGNYDKIYNWL